MRASGFSLPGVIATALALCLVSPGGGVRAQAVPQAPSLNLAVRTVVTGLVTPTTIAFLGPNDILVLEKTTGRVKRIADGAVQNGARSRRELRLGARPARYRTRLLDFATDHGENPGLDREHDRRGYQRALCDAVARKQGRPVHLGRSDA